MFTSQLVTPTGSQTYLLFWPFNFTSQPAIYLDRGFYQLIREYIKKLLALNKLKKLIRSLALLRDFLFPAHFSVGISSEQANERVSPNDLIKY